MEYFLRIKKSIVIIIAMLAIFSTFTSYGQERWDEKMAHMLLDSIINKKKATKPLKATLLSAAFPGAGQVYNRQYYKLHLVYGAIGGMIFAIDWNTRQFKRYDEAYRARLMGQPTPEFPDFIPNLSLSNKRNEFRKDKEMAYFGLGIIYLLNVADAFVSSHLSSFNIEDDLISGNLKFMDAMDLTGVPYPALGVVISF